MARNKAKQAAAARRHYERNREAVKARAAAWTKKDRDEVRAWIKDLKEQTPCMDCGHTFPYYVTDFDHLTDDKDGTVSEMIRRGFSRKKIANEIEKCELVCANCHRQRTHQRRMRSGAVVAR